MDEITVLDYFRFKLNPKNWNREILPEDTELDELQTETTSFAEQNTPKSSFVEVLFQRIRMLRTEEQLTFSASSAIMLVLAFTSALLAQLSMEPHVVIGSRNPLPAILLYGLSAILLGLNFFHHRHQPSSNIQNESNENSLIEVDKNSEPVQRFFRLEWFAASAISASIAFLLFGGNRFTIFNLFFWIASIVLGIISFLPGVSISRFFRRLWLRLKDFQALKIRFSPWQILVFCVFCICVYFRFSQINEIPGDMFSDHAEKLYDVMDVLDGKTSIFFVRNTGREAFQFYWTALIIKLFGTGISFLSLKIGTVLAGLFALPYIYLLGKLFGNRWVGLFAMLFCGVAYWPNVISRVALRFAFYPMFTAPALYHLFKGLMQKSRKDFILCGIFLGIGLQGYSAMRIVPIVIAIIFMMSLFPTSNGNRKDMAISFGIMVFFTILSGLPLLRVFLDMPESVFYRVMTRIGETETSLTKPAILIFLINFWKAAVMPFWNNGGIWVHSVLFRPALDVFSAPLFFLGSILVFFRYLKNKRWQDLSMLLCVPFLMLPSSLSIAFPDENPCLNRTGAAVIPIFIISSFGFCYLVESIIEKIRRPGISILLPILFAFGITTGICISNYHLVFQDYRVNYDRNALNTRQIGSVIKGFADSVGDYESAFVIPYPYWVDTRLVGINAGVPRKDYALARDMISSVGNAAHPLLFIYKEDDLETAKSLNQLYPDGKAILQESIYPGKSFYSFLVP